MAAPIAWREPANFTAGDSLIFNKNLPNYLPSDGWAVALTLTRPTPTGARVITTVNSTPDSANDYHKFNVALFAAGQPSDTYILSEEVFNATTGEKHQVYYDNNFVVTAAGESSVPVQTEAQQMLATLSSTLKDLYNRRNKETDVQRNRFILQDIEKMEASFKFWTYKRQEEIQIENARNGRATGATQTAVFSFF